ncbi:MAG TPA: hypothetical protein VFF52_15625 [Isosphaeraceae bacterium]|nr:hypothetical protein [Isosphaeraceae bacterium]
MGVLGDRLIVDGVGYRLRSDGSAVADLIGRLESGELPGAIVATGAVTPADLIAALAHDALGDDAALGLPLVQAPPRRPRLARALSEPAWAAVFPGAASRSRRALAAGLLQLGDFWDASHEAAQQADDQGERDYSAYWHGLAHRREPDPGNAAYWFRRVGRHPVFAPLAAAARPLLDEHGDSALAGRLISGGTWNAMAMIDLCTEARPDTPRETLARRLQRLEMWLLLEATYAGLAALAPK